jgi:hypothetical protein
MKTRWKILIAAGIFMALSCAVSFVTMRVQPENKVEAYKKLLRDKGEKLEISEVLPPPVPSESNGVEVVEAAFKSFIPGSEEYSNLPPTMRMIAPGKAIISSAQPFWFDSGRYDSSNSWENAESAVEANRFAADLLKQAAGFSVIEFQLDYRKGFDIRLPHLDPLKRSAQRLSAAAMCELHRGDAASATTNLCTLLALVQGWRDERVWISQLVRVAMANIAVNATWELLQSTNASDDNLMELQARWQQQEFFSGVESSVTMERAWAEFLIKSMRISASEFGRVTGGGAGGSFWSFTSSGNWLDDIGGLAKSGWESGKGYGGLALWQNSWGFDDEMRLLKQNQIELEALREARTNKILKPVFDGMAAQLATMRITNAPSPFMRAMEWEGVRWLFSEQFFGASRNIGNFTRIETAKEIVVAAIALKRFQLQRGKFPEKLSDLAPGFLPSVPFDPMDGKPLRYRANADGTFLLYSVGDDGVDDGGDATPVKLSSSTPPNWNWQRARDWVWPQPASTEEVKNYYDEQAAKAAAAASAAMPGMPPPPPP